MTPREWTAHAIAEDPAHEAHYRQFEWFCLWTAQGRGWSAARSKLARQAVARAAKQMTAELDAVAQAAERFGAATSKTAEAAESFCRIVRAGRAQEDAMARAWRMFCGSTA